MSNIIQVEGGTYKVVCKNFLGFSELKLYHFYQDLWSLKKLQFNRLKGNERRNSANNILNIIIMYLSN